MSSVRNTDTLRKRGRKSGLFRLPLVDVVDEHLLRRRDEAVQVEV